MPQHLQTLKTASKAPSAAPLPVIAYGVYVCGRKGIVCCTDGRAYPQYVYTKEMAQAQADELNAAKGWSTVEQSREYFKDNEPRIVF